MRRRTVTYGSFDFLVMKLLGGGILLFIGLKIIDTPNIFCILAGAALCVWGIIKYKKDRQLEA